MAFGEKVYWDNRMAFVLAAIGSAIGLGNIWRFPYICYKYGGGAFLVAYIIALIIAGLPLLILEFSLGQKIGGSAPTSIGKVSKKFAWLGWMAIIVGFFITTYYAVIMSWAANYLVHSLSLAWGDDPKTFFYTNVLGLSDGIFKIGSPRIPLLIGLVVVWAWIILSIWKGAKTVSKVVYVTVTLPWLILLVLVIGGLTLPGAFKGIAYYLTPNWSALLNPELWQAAFTQVFFSLSVGFGVMIAYASFLPPKSDIVNNAFIIGLSDAATAFVGGFAVFSVLGYYAQIQGVSVAEVMKSGPELAFVTYPAIINHLPLGPLVGVLFFVMLLTLAIDSAFSLVEAVVAGVMETFGITRTKTNIAVGILAFLIGIIYTTTAGLYWLDVVDYYMSYFALFAVAFLESVLVGWLFDTEKLRRQINETSLVHIGRWWVISVRIIVPLAALVLLVLTIGGRIKSAYGGYPRTAELIAGWIPILFAIVLGVLLGKSTAKMLQKE
ncbi:sodium-dependent transporter [bacterium]|nr:MAG: sodium-dependent transporter [bacterium]